ncbi:MAG: hypothetical protein RLZZ214_1768, partial [Verrucomicrobiota bacterium]
MLSITPNHETRNPRLAAVVVSTETHRLLQPIMKYQDLCHLESRPDRTNKSLLTGLLLTACICATANAAPSFVASPDGKIKIHLLDDAPAGLSYQIEMDGKTVVASSRLGIRSDGKDLGSNARLGSPVARRIDETYPLRGVKSTAVNRANEAIFEVTSDGRESYQLEVRAYDDGVATRLRLPAKPGRTVEGDLTEWQLPADSTCWFQNELHSYEGPYLQESVGKLKTGTQVGLPATVSLAGGGFLLATEAALVDYPDLALTVAADHSWKALLHAEPDGWKTDAEVLQPWRATLIARDLNALVNSDLVTNLCPAPTPELANADWIRPGRASWHWMAIGDPLLAEQSDWIQWTADLGFEYYLIDDGWKQWRDGDLDEWACLKRTCKQAAEKKVDIWLWVHSKEVSDSVSRRAYFEKTRAAGVVGIKIDFMPAANRQWANWYVETLRDAAAAKLMVDFHGAVKPTGLQRTWPNELTREGVRGHEWHITRYDRKLTSDHDPIDLFVRGVQGPADFTPTVFETKELQGFTWARELAQAVLHTSPFYCYGGHPGSYLANPAVDIIRELPATWDETRVLPGSEIGSLAAFARRKGDRWFIGAMNGAENQKLSIDLGFLAGGTWKLTAMRDSAEQPDAYERKESTVTSKDRIELN